MKNNQFYDLWQQLTSTDLVEVQVARQTLIQMGEQIRDDLLSVIETGTDKQIANAVIVMGEIGDTCYEETLCQFLQRHENCVVRFNAAKMLGKFCSEQVIETLASHLEHDNEMVGMWILSSLGTIGGERAKQALLDYLQLPPSHTMCYMTLRALGDIGDEDLVPIITPYLKHSKHHVRTDAQLALEKIEYQSRRSTQ